MLLGCFRLYGHATIKIAKQENAINESIEQSIETLISKDSHGLWSSTLVKLIQDPNYIVKDYELSVSQIMENDLAEFELKGLVSKNKITELKQKLASSNKAK